MAYPPVIKHGMLEAMNHRNQWFSELDTSSYLHSETGDFPAMFRTPTLPRPPSASPSRRRWPRWPRWPRRWWAPPPGWRSMRRLLRSWCARRCRGESRRHGWGAVVGRWSSWSVLRSLLYSYIYIYIRILYVHVSFRSQGATQSFPTIQ